MCDLKATQMNVQHSFIQDLMLYMFKLDHNAMEAAKNIFCKKGEGAIDSSSSCHAASMDTPDPLSPLLPIIHRFWQVFRATYRILT